MKVMTINYDSFNISLICGDNLFIVYETIIAARVWNKLLDGKELKMNSIIIIIIW